MAECYTLEQHLARARDIQVLRLPGVTVATIQLDLLHVVDKGCACYLMGSVLFQVIQHEGLQGNLHQRVEYVWYCIQQIYDELQTPRQSRLPQLNFSMVCSSEARQPSSYPELGQCKAAHLRHLVSAVAVLLRRFDLGTEVSQHRRRCVERMRQFYDVAYACDVVPTSEQADELLLATHTCILHYSWLAHHFAQNGMLLYLLVPKFHYWYHAAQQSRWCSPRHSATCTSEDFVGRVAAIAGAVIKGRGPTKVGAAVVRNYRAAIEVRCHRRLL